MYIYLSKKKKNYNISSYCNDKKSQQKFIFFVIGYELKPIKIKI